MPSKSKSQQRFMGMVHNCKKTGKCASKEVAKTAKSMKDSDAEDFASTKHKGLPEKKKVKENTMKKQNKLMVEFINNMCEKDYFSARKSLNEVVNEKIKDRIKKTATGKTEEA